MKSQVWIGKKRLKKPLIQGGMGIGVSLSGLAGAVAKEGGAGTISAAQIGFLQPEFCLLYTSKLPDLIRRTLK